MINFNFRNPLLMAMEEEKRRLNLGGNPSLQSTAFATPTERENINQVPRLGSLSNLNNILDMNNMSNTNTSALDTTPINFNTQPGMDNLNLSLNNLDPTFNLMGSNLNNALATNNFLDTNPLITGNDQQSGSGSSSLEFLNKTLAPEVPKYSKFGNFLASGMKGGLKTQKELEELAINNPEALKKYNEDREFERNQTLSAMLYNLGEYMREGGKPMSPNEINQQRLRADQLRVTREAQERFDEAYKKAPPEVQQQMDLLGRDAWNEMQVEKFKDKNTALMRNINSLNDIELQIQKELAKPESQQDPDLLRQLQNTRTAYMVGIGGDEYDFELGLRESKINARKKQDEQFAKDDLKWQTTDRATAYNNIINVRTAMNTLQSGENVSGLDVSLLDEFEWLQAGIFPAAANFKSDIRDIVFQSLREKLGAQFTEREGDRLVAAAFNSKLTEEENYARVQRLLDATLMIYDNKQGMSDYFAENGTLQGYVSNAPDIYEISASVSGIPEDFKSWAEDEETLKAYGDSLKNADGKHDDDAKNKLDIIRSYLLKLEREKRAEERRNR